MTRRGSMRHDNEWRADRDDISVASINSSKRTNVANLLYYNSFASFACNTYTTIIHFLRIVSSAALVHDCTRTVNPILTAEKHETRNMKQS
jgi:hypothetical protein